MTRDETVALFLECEAKRAEARAAALAGGKAEDEREMPPREAAKAHWNAWAEPLLAERKAMEADGRWAAEKNFGRLKPKNEETRAWMKAAQADLLPLSLSCKGGGGDQRDSGRRKRERRRRTACQINSA